RPPLRAINVETSDLMLQVVRAGSDPNLVRLGATLPNLELFPIKELNRTMASAGRRAPLAAHKYDAPPGNRALRVQVARRAMEAGCTLAPDDIITTVGATEAINLCLRAVAKPGDVIASQHQRHGQPAADGHCRIPAERRLRSSSAENPPPLCHADATDDGIDYPLLS